jgi:hypothetical protein
MLRLTFISLLTGVVWVGPTYAGSCFELSDSCSAVSAVRAQVNSQCSCHGLARSDYVRCARDVVNAAVDAGTLQRSCRGHILRCARKSTCGYPAGYVTCCQTSTSGVTKCSVKRSAAECNGSAGSTCVGAYSSCCDSCLGGGCIIPTPSPTRTITPTPSITPTPTFPPFCQGLAELPSSGQVPFTLDGGASDCGGPLLSPPPQAPFSGAVFNGPTQVASLGLGCLYTGSLPGTKIPDGGTSILEVVGVGLGTVTLGPSDGTGPANCTRAAGPGMHCLNAAPGTDGQGTCTSDADCPGIFPTGACSRDANCFFGPPVPVPGAAVPVCIVNALESDMCGAVDLLAAGTTTLTTFLTARVYQSDGDFANPCPRCISNVCNGGPNVGLACTTTSSTQTSVDCPPSRARFFAKIPVVLPEITTGTSELEDPDGELCPGSAGAFGLIATRVTETGAGLGSNVAEPNRVTVAGAFCIPPTGNGGLDFAAGFPAVGALSATGTMDLSGVVGLPPLP